MTLKLKHFHRTPTLANLPPALQQGRFTQLVLEHLSQRPSHEWPAITAEWAALRAEIDPLRYPAYAAELSGAAKRLMDGVEALQRRWGDAFPASFYVALLSPIGDNGALTSKGLGYSPAQWDDDRKTDTVLHALGMSFDLLRAVDAWLAQYNVQVTHWDACGCCGGDGDNGAPNMAALERVEKDLNFHATTFCVALVWQRLVWDSCPHLPSFKNGPSAR